MKRLIGILIVLLICFGSNSCQKEFSISTADSTSGTSTVSGTFTAKIDGIPFTANKAAGATRALNVISIAGLASDGQTIVFRVADSGVHVYSFDINSLSNAATYNQDSSYAYATNQGETADQSGGTLSITSIDTVNKKMSGTFSIKVFRAMDLKQKIITEGVFKNIPYGNQAVSAASSSDTFRVKVDSVPFPVYSISGFSVYGKINLSVSDQAASRAVGITIPANSTPGSYAFTSFGPDYMGQYNIGNSYLVADTGTIVIVEHNTLTKRIRGTFNFHAGEISGSKTALLTEGYFSIGYK